MLNLAEPLAIKAKVRQRGETARTRFFYRRSP